MDLLRCGEEIFCGCCGRPDGYRKKQKMGIPVSVQQAAGFLSRAGQLNHCNSFRVKEKYIRSIKIKRLKEVIRNESRGNAKPDGLCMVERHPQRPEIAIVRLFANPTEYEQLSRKRP